MDNEETFKMVTCEGSTFRSFKAFNKQTHKLFLKMFQICCICLMLIAFY